MVDISKKKEDVKKEIRSLLLSAPVGLTLAELERDYCLFMGNKLPSKELGYANVEEFLEDIPDTVQMTYKAGTLVLTGISDITTKHIQNLVSNQRLDTRKNWATLKIPTAPAFSMGHKTVWNKWNFSAYNESMGNRSFNSSPDHGWRHQTVNPLRDFRQAELRSDSRYKTNTSLLDSPHARPCSYSQHQTVRSPPLLRDIQLAEPCINTYDRSPRISPLLKDFRHTDSHVLHQTVRIPPLLRDTQHMEPCTCSYCRNVGKVPLFIQNNVDMIVKAFSITGVPLLHFPNIYRKHFGCTLDFWKLGFSSLYDFLSSLRDIVTLKKSFTGEVWVMRQNKFPGHPFYNGPVSNGRPAQEIVYETDHVQFPRGRTIQTGKSLLDASTDAEEESKAQSKLMCQMPTLDVEKATALSAPPSGAHSSLSSHSNNTENPQASHLDKAHGSLTSHLDKTHSSLTSHPDTAHGSLTSHPDKAHGSLTSHPDKAHGSLTSHINKAHGSLTSHPDTAHGSLTSHPDKAIGSLTPHIDKAIGSLTPHLDKVHGSLTSHSNKAHDSLTSHFDKAHDSLTSHIDKVHGSLTSHLDKAHDSLTSHPDKVHGSLTSHLDKAHDSLTSHPDKARGSLTSHIDKAHGSLTPHLDKAHDSLTSHIDKVHGSLTSHIDKAHGSLTSHLDKAHDSLTSHHGKAHGSLTSHPNKVHGSLTSCLDKAHCTPSHHNEAHDSPTSQLDESHSSADSHLGTSCNIPLTVQDHIRQIMEERQRGLYASRLPFEYWSLFKEELPLKKFGYTSVVEFASQLPHIIKVERPHPQGDWHLLPASIKTMSEISDRTLTTNLEAKTQISSFHADGSTRETVAQTLGMQREKLSLENFDRASKEKSDPGIACATADVNTCNNETDSSDVLSISVLEQALSTLEVKRNRLLNRIILEKDCSSQSVDELTEIEQNMTRVGTEISKLQNNPAQTVDPQPLASDVEKQLSQNVTKLECSKPSVQIKSMQKVAPMQRILLPQIDPVMKPTNTSAQTMLDMTSLLREQILLNKILMERLNLSHEKLPSQLPPQDVTQVMGNLQPGQPLSQPGHQPLIGNLTVNVMNLLNPDLLLGTRKNDNLLQQDPWPLQSSTVMYQGLRQLNHLLQVNQLPKIPQSALNSGLTTLNIGVQTSKSLTEPH